MHDRYRSRDPQYMAVMLNMTDYVDVFSFPLPLCISILTCTIKLLHSQVQLFFSGALVANYLNYRTCAMLCVLTEAVMACFIGGLVGVCACIGGGLVTSAIAVKPSSVETMPTVVSERLDGFRTC